MKIKLIFLKLFFIISQVYFIFAQESFLNSKQELRSHSFENDALYLSKEKSGPIESIILQYDSYVAIKKFDTLGREISKKIYEQKDGEDFLREAYTFQYLENNLFYHTMQVINYSEKILSVYLYDEKGRLKTLEKKEMISETTLETGKLLLKELYVWDSSDRLIQKDEEFELNFIRYENSYEKSFANDSIYDQKKFINDILQEETIYTSASQYTNIHYFPNEQKIFSFYKDGVKIEEIFYQGEKIIRRLSYE